MQDVDRSTLSPKPILTTDRDRSKPSKKLSLKPIWWKFTPNGGSQNLKTDKHLFVEGQRCLSVFEKSLVHARAMSKSVLDSVLDAVSNGPFFEKKSVSNGHCWIWKSVSDSVWNAFATLLGTAGPPLREMHPSVGGRQRW